MFVMKCCDMKSYSRYVLSFFIWFFVFVRIGVIGGWLFVFMFCLGDVIEFLLSKCEMNVFYVGWDFWIVSVCFNSKSRGYVVFSVRGYDIWLVMYRCLVICIVWWVFMFKFVDVVLSILIVFSLFGCLCFFVLILIEVIRNSLASFTSWRNARVVFLLNNFVCCYVGVMVFFVVVLLNEVFSV